MSVINRNRKWLAGVACTVLVAGAAIGWAEVRIMAVRTSRRVNVRGLSTVFREVAKSARPGRRDDRNDQQAYASSRKYPFLIWRDSPFGDMLRNQPESPRIFPADRRTGFHARHRGSGFVIDPRGSFSPTATW